MKFSRRDFISHLRNILGTASVYPFIPHRQLLAQDNPEHYFIFVELKGGVHHTLIADFPDIGAINALAKKHPNAVMRFPLRADDMGFFGNKENYANGALRGDLKKFIDLLKIGLKSGGETVDPHKIMRNPAAHRQNGYFCALPTTDGVGQIYMNEGKKRLGPAGLSLQEHRNYLSVLRGVYMLGNFHGIANREIFSGSSDGSGPHVAGVLAKLLVEDKKLASRPLDNIVIDGATYSFGSEAGNIKAPIKLSLDALAKVAGEASTGGLSLDPAKILAVALQEKYRAKHSAELTAIIDKYIQAFADTKEIKRKVGNAIPGDKNGFAKQLHTCLNLFASGLSRVATVCVGDNANFGRFDSHSALYHSVSYEGKYSEESYYTKIKDDMQGLATFISDLSVHALASQVTVVISSEFGRSNNFAGNLDSDADGLGMFGNDHYYFNNNYILFGKNVARGQWLGESDPITRYPQVCDFAKLANDYNNAFTSPISVSNVENDKPKYGEKIVLRDGFSGGALRLSDDRSFLDTGVVHRTSNPNHRAIMAKDVVRTIMKIAGLDNKFWEYYPGDAYREAKIIENLLA